MENTKEKRDVKHSKFTHWFNSMLYNHQRKAIINIKNRCEINQKTFKNWLLNVNEIPDSATKIIENLVGKAIFTNVESEVKNGK